MSRDCKHLRITSQSIEIKGYDLSEVVEVLKRVPTTFNPPPVATQGALGKIERKLTMIWEVLEDVELGVLNITNDVAESSDREPQRINDAIDCETNCCPSCCGCEGAKPKNANCWCGLGKAVGGG